MAGHKMGAGKHKRPVWGPDHGKGKDKFAAYRNNVDVYGVIFVADDARAFAGARQRDDREATRGVPRLPAHQKREGRRRLRPRLEVEPGRAGGFSRVRGRAARHILSRPRMSFSKTAALVLRLSQPGPPPFARRAGPRERDTSAVPRIRK